MKYILILLFIIFPLINFALIINIPDDQPTIQLGIEVAVDTDTVLVQPGTYVENINYNGKSITVASLFLTTQDTTFISQTTIDGNQTYPSVVTFESEEDSTAILIGFTIQNGSFGYGGGIYCDNSSPSLQNLILTNNDAVDYGGGIACFNYSNPNLENLSIINNSAYYGGGIYCYYSNPSIYDVLINNNSAQAGAGIYCESSNPNIESVIISSNSANSGGGIYCCWSSNPNLENVMIINNSAGSGAGICCQDSDPNLTNVTITGNSAGRGGGILCESNSNPNLENVAINNNTAYYGGGIFCWFNSYPIFSSENRCNIYSNIYTNSRGAGMDIFIYESQLPVIDVFVDTFTVMRPTDYYASPIDNFAFDILHSVEDSLINSDVYVSVEGDNSNLGTSPETPFKTIKYALSRIYSDNMNINTIHLAAGIYSPTTNGESFPIKWSNYLNLSGSGEEETILDAENSGGVMEFLSVSDALIENLTITGGSASDGGGIFCRDHSNPCFKNVVIINNSAVYFGGGIYCYDYSNPSLENVELSGNSSNSGGGISCRSNSNPSLENVTIADNTAEYNGGGILCGYSSPSLENVTITGNSANGNYYSGGGILCSHSSPSLINVTISNNFALSGGGINCRSNSNPSLENVTISDNSAIYGGGISCRSNSSPCLLNSILWNDSPQEIYFNESYDPNSITISYSDIQGGEAGIVTNNNGIVNWLEGNIDEDPLFIDPANGDYHLTENSPCIDAGNPNQIYYDPEDPYNPGYALYPAMGTIINDMGAYGGPNAIGWIYVSVEDEFFIEPVLCNLYQNYPNPFNPQTTISFSVAQTSSFVTLGIYNIKGQKIKTIVNQKLEQGLHQIIWDGKNDNNQYVASGVYFYKLKVNDKNIAIKKCLLLK